MNNNPTKKILKKFEEYLQSFGGLDVNKVSPNMGRTLIVSYEMIFAKVPVMISFATYQVKSEEAKQALVQLFQKSNTDLKNLSQLLYEVLNANPRDIEWGQELQKIGKRMDPHRDFLDELSFRSLRKTQLLFTLFLLDRVERHCAHFFSEVCIHRLGVTNQYFGTVLGDKNGSLLLHAFEAEYNVLLGTASARTLVDAELDMEATANYVQNIVRDMFAPALIPQFA